MYKEHKKVWRTNTHPLVTTVFVEHSTEVETITLSEDTLLVPGEETYVGIVKKTIEALEYFLQDKSYTHILRTNLSSVWHFPRLINDLRKRPYTGLYGGCVGNIIGINFVSGAGIHMTRDVALLLLENREKAYKTGIIDDVDFANSLGHTSVKITEISNRFDITDASSFDSLKNNIPSHVCHFRIKQTNGDRGIEPQMMTELIKYTQRPYTLR